MERPRPGDDDLAAALAALAHPSRLALMRALRVPRALREIEVGATGEAGHVRPLARQTVREHLDKLLDAGLAVGRDARRSYGDTTAFLVNHQALFALSEEMRHLAQLRPTVEPDARTLQGGDEPPPSIARPALLLVKGVDEGASFPLPQETGREWLVGRRRGLAVPLDYDPAVSAENARIWWEDGAHWVQDLPASRNGVRHNLRLLAKGERARLRHGDLLGVGCSLLLYWS